MSAEASILRQASIAKIAKIANNFAKNIPVSQRFDAQAWAYCLMGNHYHLVLHTREANLSRLMRQINGVYTQTFNRRNDLMRHFFRGRFKAILVDSDSYLLGVCAMWT